MAGEGLLLRDKGGLVRERKEAGGELRVGETATDRPANCGKF